MAGVKLVPHNGIRLCFIRPIIYLQDRGKQICIC